MAREIVVQREGQQGTFSMTKVDRSKLYGRRRRIPLGPDGEPCQRAKLTGDGSLLITQGMTAQAYFTDAGTWVPNGELVGLDDEGQALEPVGTTLGNAQVLEGPVDPSEVLDLRVQSVYALTAKELDPALQKDLEAGQVFRFPFSYRGGYDTDAAYLVANTDGDVFALVGRPTEPTWQDVKAVLPVIDEGIDDDDELDFEMF